MRTETWVAWLVTAMAFALSTRNPLYLALVLLANAVASRRSLGLRRLALILPLATAFNALTVHIGDTVLCTLPEEWPLVGGVVSLEATVYGALNGAALAVVISVFGTFARQVEPFDLIRLSPRAFQPAVMVIAVALNTVPLTARRVDEIREAMTIRGIEMRGLRDWLPLWVPLLAGGLEEASRMADALMARGIVDEPGDDRVPQVVLSAGLIGVLLGWLWRFVEPTSDAAAALMVAGAAGAAIAMWLAGHSRSRPPDFGPRRTWLDVGCLAACAAAATVALIPLPVDALAAARDTLSYVPYPRLAPPPFSPFIGLAALALALPALRAPDPE